VKVLGEEYFKNLGSYLCMSGNKKNAGKTTFLNYCSQNLRNLQKKLFLCTIGVDGESHDLVFGHAKPSVFLGKGDLFLTSSAFLNQSCFKILQETSIHTSLGTLMIAKTLQNTTCELIGVEHLEQLSSLIPMVKPFVDTILVDGAANRMTHWLSSFERIDIVQISSSTWRQDFERLAFWDLLLQREQVEAPLDILYCQGALTSSYLQEHPRKKIMVKNITKVFLKYQELKMFSSSLFVEEKLPSCTFVVHLKDISKEFFMNQLRKENIQLPFYFSPFYEEEMF